MDVKHQGTHLINDEQDAVLIADLAQRRQETGRRDKDTALAHDGLDDDGGRVGGRALLLQDPLQRVDGRIAAAARLVRIAIRWHLRTRNVQCDMHMHTFVFG